MFFFRVTCTNKISLQFSQNTSRRFFLEAKAGIGDADFWTETSVHHPLCRTLNTDIRLPRRRVFYANRIKWLEEKKWDLIILDEAQAIKNPLSKQTKAIKALKASHKLALTGTPVENSLADLWSLFDSDMNVD